MSNNGPSADEVARVVRRHELTNRLEIYSPKEFREYKLARRQEKVLIAWGVFAVVVFAILILLLGGKEGLFPALFVFILGGVGLGLLSQHPESDRLLWAFEKQMHQNAIQHERKFTKMAKKIDETAAKAAGDLIILGEGATYIVGSTIKDSFNVLKNDSPELANALAIIAGYIEGNKINGASEAYDNLADAVTKKDRPSRIRAFWNDLVQISPEIATLATAAASITALFL
jgi:hypothetical protein